MNEKQLARYLRAVRRRLSLSGQMKDRVMDDLRSSINERREAGQTDAEIFAALGPAKQAAAELTAQLPGYAFRKSPLRFVCLGAAVLALLAGLLKTVTHLRGFASVGVIGGADGPTEIFIAGPQIFDWADVIAAGIVLVLGLIGYLLLRRLPPKKGWSPYRRNDAHPPGHPSGYAGSSRLTGQKHDEDRAELCFAEQDKADGKNRRHGPIRVRKRHGLSGPDCVRQNQDACRGDHGHDRRAWLSAHRVRPQALSRQTWPR